MYNLFLFIGISSICLKLTITEKINSVTLSFGQLLSQKQKILKSMSVMQRIMKERRPTKRKSEVFLLSFFHGVFFSIP